MRKGETIWVGGARLRIDQPDLGSGGQGTAHAASAETDPTAKAVVKTLAYDADTETRLFHLINRGLGLRHPYLCAPLAMSTDAGDLLTVACFAAGEPMDEADPQPLPRLLETSIHGACLWTITEEEGVAHGDVAPSNLHVSQRGSVRLIDFDNFDLNDGSAPPPTMIGQPMMLAPELVDGSATPNRLSDRYAWAVLLSWYLLGRHPADGLADNPAERNAAMSCGYWPEHDRTPEPGELPMGALGVHLGQLFDRAFSLLPADRPSADEWRRGLMQALDHTVIHACGSAFVHDGALTLCPDCSAPITMPVAKPAHQAATGAATLVVTNTAIGEVASFALNDGDTLILGRINLPGASARVSGKHLEIRRFGDRLYLRHLGRNPTVLSGQNRRLGEKWLRIDQLRRTPFSIALADTQVEIGCV